ncbi:ABC transporter permease subunit [Cohnella sp. 56]|uniref:ABC transporter permease subunit n=1 Tax=Cohnella sp. 56 TaxID=3113722 RepID=UPI0030E80358
MNQTRRKTDWLLWAMTLPFFLLVLLFSYVPLAGWSMAFVKYIPGLSIFKSEFAGLDYFRQLFSLGSELPKAITNTLALGFLGILASPLSMILAILITEVGRSRLRRFIQVALSLPNFISFIIVYAIFFTFFSVDGGIVNQLLLKLHLVSEPTNLLGNEGATWLFQTLVIIWKTIGWSAIIYIGAITSIDMELYDAASVDGAGRFKKALHVTIPGLLPTFTVLLLLSIGNLLSSNFEQIFVFHNALNHDRIVTLDYYSYQAGLVNFDFSLGTAIGVFKSVTSLIILFAANGIIKRISGNSII